MRITRSTNGLAVFFAKLHNTAVEIAKSLVIGNGTLGNEETIVANGLDFEVIVEVDDLLDLALGSVLKDRTEKLACLAGRTDDESLAVLLQHRLGNTRKAAVVIEIAHGNELVKVLQSNLVLDENDLVIGLELERIGLFCHFLLQHTPVAQVGFFHNVDHTEEDVREHFGVITSAVVVKITEVIGVCNGIKSMLVQLGVDVARKRKGIKIGIFKGQARLFGKVADKADVKVCVVRNEERLNLFLGIVANKFEEGFERLVIFGRALDHFVGDARQLNDVCGDRDLGVNKGVESAKHLAVFDFNGTNFGNFAVLHRKTRGFNIEHHALGVQIGIVFARNGTCGVVDKVRLNAIDDLEITSLCGFFKGKHGIGKGLYVTVVGNSNSRHTPFEGCFHSGIGRNQGVHGRHGRM